jgi:hypothetical protein
MADDERAPPYGFPTEHHESITTNLHPYQLPNTLTHTTSKMVLQDLGRRINAAVTDLTRSPNLDEKVRIAHQQSQQVANNPRPSMPWSRRSPTPSSKPTST